MRDHFVNPSQWTNAKLVAVTMVCVLTQEQDLDVFVDLDFQVNDAKSGTSAFQIHVQTEIVPANQTVITACVTQALPESHAA